MELEAVWRYAGIDWLAMALTLAAIYLLGNQSRAGFTTMMGGNTCWIVVGFLSGSMAMMLANLVFLTMNARGWLKWSATP